MQLLSIAAFGQLQQLVVLFIQQQIYLAPILLLLIDEAGLPLPIADYVIMYTGYHVAKGYLSFPAAFILLLIADLVGVSILYFLSARYGPLIIHKLGRYIHLDEYKLKRVEAKFRKHGSLFIIIGRHIPGMRIPITVFAGISEVTYRQFIISTFVSVALWIPLYLYIGATLGPKVMQLTEGTGWFVLVLLLPLVFLATPLLLLRKRPAPQLDDKSSEPAVD